MNRSQLWSILVFYARSVMALAYWEAYARPLVLERLERERWIDELAGRWQLVRSVQTLTLAQRDRQRDMVARALGELFYPTLPAEWEAPISAAGYLRGIRLAGSPITTNLPIPDDDEAPELDPADDVPWTLLEQVTCSCGLLATSEPDEQYGTLWRCPCGRTYADEERQLLG